MCVIFVKFPESVTELKFNRQNPKVTTNPFTKASPTELKRRCHILSIQVPRARQQDPDTVIGADWREGECLYIERMYFGGWMYTLRSEEVSKTEEKIVEQIQSEVDKGDNIVDLGECKGCWKL